METRQLSASVARGVRLPADRLFTERVGNRYGYFSRGGSEFVIVDPNTPRPWANIISNPRMGLAVSQTGGGFTWIDNSQLAVITRWQQEFASDSSGKFLYLRDADSGKTWSLSPAPMWPQYDEYTCTHGLGYTTFETRLDSIRARWTLFVHASETVEFWKVELKNLSDRPRRLELCAFLEWNCGVSPSPRREFHKLFIETEYDKSRGVILARNHMWDVQSEQSGHWNSDFPYVSALGCTERVESAVGDKLAFFGRSGDARSPAALSCEVWEHAFGRHDDPIAAMRSTISLAPAESRTAGYALAVGETRGDALRLLDGVRSVEGIERSLVEVKKSWGDRLAQHRVETPSPTLNYLTNDWLRYQTISARMWGRCGYYQQSGAFGFRDQLQDSHVWLTIDPQVCRDQINLHAAHQFADGSALHWWHPLTEQGLTTRMSDDFLWPALLSANYIKETGDLSVLFDAQPFLDDVKPQPLLDHVLRAFSRVFSRMSERGLPLIRAGDWNDGLSAAGLGERGESIWLGQFLVGLLNDWAQILRKAPASCAQSEAAARDVDWTRLAGEFDQRREELVAAINEHGWDGQWYIRATLDDGTKLGSAENRVGKIFLNAQTWAVLNDVASADRARRCMNAVRTHLITDAGALLLAPAFSQPDERVGYITRYAPGLRENGGVYTHAATWAIAAACKLHDAELVDRLLTAINPALKDPERYWAEPYVTPGNVDGPDSPHHGRGGWTWYTGSAAWLHRVMCAWVLGVRPEFDGLRIEPCLPPDWPAARMHRPWRGCAYRIEIERDAALAGDVAPEVWLDGKKLSDNIIPPPSEPGVGHDVRVRIR